MLSKNSDFNLSDAIDYLKAFGTFRSTRKAFFERRWWRDLPNTVYIYSKPNRLSDREMVDSITTHELPNLAEDYILQCRYIRNTADTNKPKIYVYYNENLILPKRPIEYKIVASLQPPNPELDEFPACFYQSDKEREEHYLAHKTMAEILSKKLPFQHWAENNPVISDVNLLSHKSFRYVAASDDRIIPELYGVNEEVHWRFLMVVAAALVTYHNPDNRVRIRNIDHAEKNQEYTPTLPCEISRLAQRLRIMTEEMGYKSNLLNKELIKLENGVDSLPYIKMWLRPNVPTQLLRRFFIREICLTASKEFQSKNSRTGRFFPDIVTSLCSLIEYEPDKRAVQSIQSDYDPIKWRELDSETRLRIYSPLSDEFLRMKYKTSQQASAPAP